MILPPQRPAAAYLPAAVFTLVIALAPVVRSGSTLQAQDHVAESPATVKTPAGESAEKAGWIDLVGQWKACQFGGEGDVTIKDGVIKMEYGDPLTGVVWTGPFEGDEKSGDATGDKTAGKTASKTGPLPRDNYEIRWECQRTKGFDFLCAFTFPVAKDHVSLVMGGWGGGITGISSIDGQDASDNNTTMFHNYDDNRWYKARVRVDSKKITVWVDEKEMFAHERGDHRFDIRFEMDPCTPMGIANFECNSEIRNIQLRRLKPADESTEK